MSNHRDNTDAYVIVVGTDYSEAGDEALTQALDSALERDIADVHVLHVLDTGRTVVLSQMSEVPAVPEPVVVESAIAELRAYVRARLEAHGSDSTRLHRTASHLRLGEAAEEITLFAREIDADLVVVGTHPRHGSSRWLIGSVAEKVVRTALCPVLVARRKDTSRPRDLNADAQVNLPLPFPVVEATR